MERDMSGHRFRNRNIIYSYAFAFPIQLSSLDSLRLSFTSLPPHSSCKFSFNNNTQNHRHHHRPVSIPAQNLRDTKWVNFQEYKEESLLHRQDQTQLKA